MNEWRSEDHVNGFRQDDISRQGLQDQLRNEQLEYYRNANTPDPLPHGFDLKAGIEGFIIIGVFCMGVKFIGEVWHFLNEVWDGLLFIL